MQGQEKRIITLPINTTAEGCAFAIKHSYNKNFAISTATNGGGHFPCTAVEEIYETIQSNADKGGRMYLINGVENVACTITTGHDRAMNILAPNGGHKQMGVLYEYDSSTAKSNA